MCPVRWLEDRSRNTAENAELQRRAAGRRGHRGDISGDRCGPHAACGGGLREKWSRGLRRADGLSICGRQPRGAARLAAECKCARDEPHRAPRAARCDSGIASATDASAAHPQLRVFTVALRRPSARRASISSPGLHLVGSAQQRSIGRAGDDGIATVEGALRADRVEGAFRRGEACTRVGEPPAARLVQPSAELPPGGAVALERPRRILAAQACIEHREARTAREIRVARGRAEACQQDIETL